MAARSATALGLRFRARLPRAQVLVWEQGDRALSAAAAAHDGYEIAWIEAGMARYRIGSRDMDVTEGAAVLVPPFVEHGTTLSAGMRARSTWIDAALVEEIADAIGAKVPVEPTLIAAPARLTTLGDLLCSELEHEAPGTELVAHGLLEAVAVEVLRRPGASTERRTGARDPRIRRAVRFIEASFAEPLTIERIAKVAGMSRFHFTRSFREQLGTAPYQYLLRVRVQHAAQLLRTGAGVSEAALGVGLNDPGRFAALFRKRFGVSPVEYAKRARHARSTARFPHDPRREEHDAPSARATV